MRQPENLNLLVSCESQSGLDALLALFREVGHITRAHRVSSLRDLGDLLRDPQWDVLIADDRHPELSPAEALTLLAERASDLPCVVMATESRGEAAAACLRQGARDVVGQDDQERLLRATAREATALREHRELLSLRVQYAETARRAELLLAASQDAIAYVVDGMHVQANALYASLFGFGAVEDMSSVPLVDLIAASRQKEFKAALKRYAKRPEEQTSLEFTGLRTDGSEFPGELVLSTASFEGEPCMQVMVRAAVSGTSCAVEGGSSGTGLLRDAMTGLTEGFVILLGVDGYAQHCKTLGVNASNRLLDGLPAKLGSTLHLPAALHRVSDAVLALLAPSLDRNQALDLASALCLEVAERPLPAGSQNVNCIVSAVVLSLELVATEGAEAALDRGWSTLLALMERGASLRGGDPERVKIVSAPTARPDVTTATSLEAEIRSNGFRILFQPIVSLRGDSTEHYEVQVRHVTDGTHASVWLAANGCTEASQPLDKWVLIESLKKLADHSETHPLTRLILPIGVQSLCDAEFVPWLALALRAAALSADVLVLQVSHRDTSVHLAAARHLAEKLEALGSRLCISDVHIANNPMADLSLLRPQLVRLDGALAPALKDAESMNTLLKPLIESMHQEQISSIMPEVDGAGMLAVLWQLGINYIQGNYLQTPQPEMHYDFTDLA